MNRTSRTKKPIHIRQILWLLLLLFFCYYELFPLSEADTFFFPTLFLLSLWFTAQRRHILPLAWHNALASFLHPLTVRLRVFHIWQIRGNVAPPLNTKPCTCKNCGDTFTGNYCPRCGQSRNTPRYVLRGIVGNILRTVFRVDGKFAHTLLELLYRPGHMMRDFIRGRRIGYTLPLAMVFLMTAFYTLTAQLIIPEIREKKEEQTAKKNDVPLTKAETLRATIDKLELEKGQTDNPAMQKSLEISISEIEKTLAEIQRQDSIAGKPQFNSDLDEISSSVYTKVETWLEDVPFLANVWNLLKRWGHGNKAFHILLTLPLLAVATRWAFYRRRKPDMFNLMEHILIQAYIATQILLISTLVVPFNGTAHVDDLYEVPFWFIFLLFWWDYHQLYLYTWWRSFWKTVLMFTYCLVIVVILAMTGVLLLCLVQGTTTLHL